MPPTNESNARFAACRFASMLLLIAMIVGCSGIERANPRPQSARVDGNFADDTPRIMRGTIASEAVLDGYRPVIARGYGLVVGLNGTGSRDMPPNLRAHMLREMNRHGIGSERAGAGELNPEEMLNSSDTAVVIVEAVIPPGAVGRRTQNGRTLPGTPFDVRVHADPRTGTTSLEGGRLYTTELRPGPLRPGGGQSFPVARASGPIFVNPFAEPDAVERDSVTRTVGLILNGGEVTRDMPLKLRLRNPGHMRAMMIQNSINASFPRERYQADVTARGESDESIRITVPPSYRDRPEEFIALLQHTTVREVDKEAIAVSVRRALLEDPSQAMQASLRWQALGQRVRPVIKDLYDYPEELPRMAALRAGAKLDDALTVPHLSELAQNGSHENRLAAIELLAEMRMNPRIDRALRKLLDDEDVDVRLEAYEALVKRGDPMLRRHEVDNGKFVIDVVPSSKPMIYISQFGQPRVVIFGDDLSVSQPIFTQVWQNRLLVKDIEDRDEIEVFYRPSSRDIQGDIHRVAPRLDEFVRFLGHSTTVERPEAGLGLSYGEAVGTLYQIWRDRYIDADFKAEQDRILAAIVREESEPGVVTRPEFADAADEDAWDEGAAIGMSPTSDLNRLSPDPLPQMEIPVPRRNQNRRDSR